MTVLGECWDDTHKSRSVIKSRRLCCFSLCQCYTPDVVEGSELLLRMVRNPCLSACARYTYLLYQGSGPAEKSFQVDPIEPDVLNTSEFSRDR